jgi:hypothetical protein
MLNFSTTQVFTKPRCRKKNQNTTSATQGQINANTPGFFSFQ